MEAGFFFCLCPDSALLQEYLEREFFSPSAGKASASSDIRIFWADDGLSNRFWDSLTLLGMDGRHRLIVVRNAHLLPAELWRKLSAMLGTPRQGILPVFCLECPWEKGKPKIPDFVAKLKCLAFAESRKWIWRSPGLDVRTIRPYVEKLAKKKGLQLDPEALNVLLSLLMPDAAAIQGVLEQLSLASEGGLINADLVRQMTEFAPEAVIFDIIRQMENGQSREVWRTLVKEGDGGESLLFPLLTLMAREARILWQLNAGEKAQIPPFIEREKRALASRIGFAGLCRIFSLLQDAELSVKSGARQPLQAMESLVSSLSFVFAPSSRV
ncbi:MAG: DNA polymerase III subunit delta [Mailhella sp.]